MGIKQAGRRWRWAYSGLLRLYPRTFRQRFGEPMAEAFGDLCRERAGAGRSLAGLALWAFGETLAGAVRENLSRMDNLGKMVLRVALGALAVWMVPVVAAQFIEDWHWGLGGFAMAYTVFFVVGMAFALIARRMGAWTYKAGVGVALAAGLGLGWSNMVHVADSGNPANLWYYSVLVVGLVGAGLAKLRAPGLAWTLFAMAAVLAALAVALPSGAPPDLARNMAMGHALNVVLFLAAGLLFRQAAFARAA